MPSKKAFRASAKARKGQSTMTDIMRQGEKAAIHGYPVSANPYSVGTEDSELWLEGYNDAVQIKRWNFIERRGRLTPR